MGPGVIDMHYNNVGTLLQNGRGGKALHIVHIRLEDGSPEGLRIQVNRWMEPTEGDYMNVKSQCTDKRARMATAETSMLTPKMMTGCKCELVLERLAWIPKTPCTPPRLQ